MKKGGLSRLTQMFFQISVNQPNHHYLRSINKTSSHEKRRIEQINADVFKISVNQPNHHYLRSINKTYLQ